MEIDKAITGTTMQLITNSDQGALAEIRPIIRVIRGRQVMLDCDLAKLYQVETKRLNEQVKRNIKRFPDDFMFQLTPEECLRSQIATSNEKQGRGGKRYLPYVFTEQGISMLRSVLRSDVAIEVNICIMRAFVAMRHFLADNAQLFNRIELLGQGHILLNNKHDVLEQQVKEVFRARCQPHR